MEPLSRASESPFRSRAVTPKPQPLHLSPTTNNCFVLSSGLVQICLLLLLIACGAHLQGCVQITNQREHTHS